MPKPKKNPYRFTIEFNPNIPEDVQATKILSATRPHGRSAFLAKAIIAYSEKERFLLPAGVEPPDLPSPEEMAERKKRNGKAKNNPGEVTYSKPTLFSLDDANMGDVGEPASAAAMSFIEESLTFFRT